MSKEEHGPHNIGRCLRVNGALYAVVAFTPLTPVSRYEVRKILGDSVQELSRMPASVYVDSFDSDAEYTAEWVGPTPPARYGPMRLGEYFKPASLAGWRRIVAYHPEDGTFDYGFFYPSGRVDPGRVHIRVRLENIEPIQWLGHAFPAEIEEARQKRAEPAEADEQVAPVAPNVKYEPSCEHCRYNPELHGQYIGCGVTEGRSKEQVELERHEWTATMVEVIEQKIAAIKTPYPDDIVEIG